MKLCRFCESFAWRWDDCHVLGQCEDLEHWHPKGGLLWPNDTCDYWRSGGMTPEAWLEAEAPGSAGE